MIGERRGVGTVIVCRKISVLFRFKIKVGKKSYRKRKIQKAIAKKSNEVYTISSDEGLAFVVSTVNNLNTI